MSDWNNVLDDCSCNTMHLLINKPNDLREHPTGDIEGLLDRIFLSESESHLRVTEEWT